MLEETKVHYIYTLSDNKGVRYVGQTLNPQRRYNAHCSLLQNNKNTHKDRWIRSLLKKNIKPTLDIVLKTTNPDEEEVKLIKSLKEKGIKLVNTTEGGKDNKHIQKAKENTPWKGTHTPLQDILINFRQVIRMFKKKGDMEKVEKIEGFITKAQELVNRLGKDEVNKRLYARRK